MTTTTTTVPAPARRVRCAIKGCPHGTTALPWQALEWLCPAHELDALLRHPDAPPLTRRTGTR